MVMIAFTTVTSESSLVHLVKGLFAQIQLDLGLGIAFTSSSRLFCERRDVLKEDPKAVSLDVQPAAH